MSADTAYQSADAWSSPGTAPVNDIGGMLVENPAEWICTVHCDPRPKALSLSRDPSVKVAMTSSAASGATGYALATCLLVLTVLRYVLDIKDYRCSPQSGAPRGNPVSAQSASGMKGNPASATYSKCNAGLEILLHRKTSICPLRVVDIGVAKPEKCKRNEVETLRPAFLAKCFVSFFTLPRVLLFLKWGSFITGTLLYF
ncbi:hypothetical protein V8F33_009205 [Rhypophila sp. PSN 637]